MRVPTPNVSAVDLTFGTSKGPSVEDVKAVMKQASENGMKGIIKYSDLPLVSTDFAGTRTNRRSSTLISLMPWATRL